VELLDLRVISGNISRINVTPNLKHDQYNHALELTTTGTLLTNTGDQKVSVHVMITKDKVTSNDQSVPRLTTWLNLTAWQLTARARRTLDSH
jgi:hypothetical protein